MVLMGKIFSLKLFLENLRKIKFFLRDMEQGLKITLFILL